MDVLHRCARPGIGALAVVVLLAGTQIPLRVQNSWSVGGAKSVSLTEVLGCLLLVAVAVRVATPAGRRRVGPAGRYLAAASAILVVVWLALSGLRRLIEHRGALAITMVELLLVAVACALAVLLGWLPHESIAPGLLAFLTGAQAWVLVRGLTGSQSFRAMSPLGNINLYIAFLLGAIPFVAHWVLGRTTARWLSVVLFADFAAAIVIAVLSGSRFGGVATIAVIVIVLLVLDERPWRVRLATSATGLVLAVVGVVGLVHFQPALLPDLSRTFNLASVLHGSEPDTAQIEQEQAAKAAAGQTPAPAPPDPHVRNAPPGDPDYEAAPPGLNIFNRTRVFKRALAVAGAHWALGTGRHVMFFAGWGYQPAHNIILEAVICFGVFGSVPYFALALAPVLLLVRRPGGRARLAYFVGFGMVFAFSLVQPLLSESLLVLLVLWLPAGALLAGTVAPHVERTAAATTAKADPAPSPR